MYTVWELYYVSTAWETKKVYRLGNRFTSLKAKRGEDMLLPLV